MLLAALLVALGCVVRYVSTWYVTCGVAPWNRGVDYRLMDGGSYV